MTDSGPCPYNADRRLGRVEADMAVLKERSHLVEVHDEMLRGGGGTKPLPQELAGVQQSVATLTADFTDFRKEVRDGVAVARNAIVVGVIILALEGVAGLAWLGLRPAAVAQVSPASTHQKVERALGAH